MKDIPDLSVFPEEIPVDGLMLNQPGWPKLGFWIMPDNRQSGMLEDFLVDLIPTESSELFDFAKECVDQAKTKGADFKDNHKRKAEIYTWLGWQNPPGKQLHEAINMRILDPHKPTSKPFVKWFCELFGI